MEATAENMPMSNREFIIWKNLEFFLSAIVFPPNENAI